MTSIDWFISVLAHNDILDHKKVSSNKQLYNLYLRLKEQAKEMHKVEIIDAWEMGRFNIDDVGLGEQYYQETFVSKGSDDHIVDTNEMVDQVPDVRKMVEDDVWEKMILVGLQDELNKLPYTKHLDDGQYNDGQLAGFELGATWGYNKAKEMHKQEMAQLPQQEISDEEIEEEISKRYMHPTQDYAWRDACKWYREQLKQRQ